jgi:para-aminobenzoate synthetase/4-amino-4-deoxychorismate lyase
VRVPRLFELHALPTVWQMTSTITAVSRPHVRLSEVFAALFPCGSVTGTPKVRAMQVIRDLEPTPRGLYCGALGLIQPGGVATFNVPIRTVEQCGDVLMCGIGSAITLDAEPAAELAEWRAKARFLARAQAPIAALETLRLEDGQFVRLAAHLSRLQRTAQHFGLRLSMSKVRAALATVAADTPDGVWRVRLTVNAQGEVDVQRQPLAETAALVALALAATPVASDNEFLRHKTIRREVYQPFIDAKPPGTFDVLLWNEAGELTECSFGNVALLIDGQWQTPRQEAGLLPGVLREAMLARGEIHEARLMVADLQRAEAFAFLNSLRGLLPAVMHGTK